MRNTLYKIFYLVVEQYDRRTWLLDIERPLEIVALVRRQRHFAVEADFLLAVPFPGAGHVVHHAIDVRMEAFPPQAERVGQVENVVVGVVYIVDGRRLLQQVPDDAFARPGVHDRVVLERRYPEGVDLDARAVGHEPDLLLTGEEVGEAGFLDVGGGEHHAIVVVYHADVDLQCRVVRGV